MWIKKECMAPPSLVIHFGPVKPTAGARKTATATLVSSWGPAPAGPAGSAPAHPPQDV